MAAATVTERKVVRQTETFLFNLGGALAEEKGALRDVTISTKPDEVIVRQITVSGTANPGVITYINCTAVKGTPLGSFSGAADSSVSPNATFTIGQNVKNLTFSFNKFDAIDAQAAAIPTTTVAAVAITLEFRSYC